VSQVFSFLRNCGVSKKKQAFFLGFPENGAPIRRSQISGVTTAASMRREDALEIIGVAEDACDKTITRAFRSLAQKHHPGAFPLRPPCSLSATTRD
jgi:DnaJ-domain-containing protein 1